MLEHLVATRYAAEVHQHQSGNRVVFFVLGQVDAEVLIDFVDVGCAGNFGAVIIDLPDVNFFLFVILINNLDDDFL